MNSDACLLIGPPLCRVEAFLRERTAKGEEVSPKTIGYRTNLCRKTVCAALKVLVAKGLAVGVRPKRFSIHMRVQKVYKAVSA